MWDTALRGEKAPTIDQRCNRRLRRLNREVKEQEKPARYGAWLIAPAHRSSSATASAPFGSQRWWIEVRLTAFWWT
jgi:hypothetical protein